MQSFSWAPQHCEALRQYVAAGLSFAEAADALNEKFGTDFSRSAVIGRAKRMKLVVRARPGGGPQLAPPRPKPAKATLRQSRQRPAGTSPPASPPVKLRCVGIQPRLMTFHKLADGDCRYPYGGEKEGEPIMFCGHPRFRGSSYCAPHLHLTRGPRIEDERPAGRFTLRLIAAA